MLFWSRKLYVDFWHLQVFVFCHIAYSKMWNPRKISFLLLFEVRFVPNIIYECFFWFGEIFGDFCEIFCYFPDFRHFWRFWCFPSHKNNLWKVLHCNNIYFLQTYRNSRICLEVAYFLGKRQTSWVNKITREFSRLKMQNFQSIYCFYMNPIVGL